MRLLTLAASLIALPAPAQTVPPGTPAAAPAAPSAAPPSAAAAKASPALDRRLAELIPLLSGAGDYAATFAPTFIAAVPKDKFDALARQLIAGAGKPLKIDGVQAATPNTARFVIVYERGRATAEMSVEPTGAGRIDALRITGMAANEATLSAADAALAKLPGRTAFALAKLGTGAPQLLDAREADTKFAIGSQFKLVILAELVRGIAAGQRGWDDLVTLDGGPLPGGGYTQAPAGTRVSLYDLAERMISVSDNSATDILLKTLGRDKVEAMLPVVGIADPRGMRPFLGTLEVFKLKTSPLGARYAAADEAACRALLADEVASMPLSAIDNLAFARGKPLAIDTLEWFATPADMIRTMDWLRRHSETGPAARARTILSKNSALSAPAKARWGYAGYKGGSEPGVIAMTWLLQAKDGGWYALSGSWNDTDKPVDDTRFAGLMTRAVELAAP